MECIVFTVTCSFYDNSISPGAKIRNCFGDNAGWFYDNSISPGAKIL